MYSGNTAIDAGQYTATATVSGEGYKTAVFTTQWEIKQIDSGLTLESVNPVYTGEPITLEVTGDIPIGVDVTYENNTHTIVGEYDVVANIDGGINYISKELTAKLIIQQASESGATLPNITVTYDGQPHSLVVAGAPEDAVITWSGEHANEQTNAGVYNITATITTDNFVDIEHGVLTINKANIDKTNIKFDNKTEVYTGSEISVEIETSDVVGLKEVTYVNNTLTNVGSVEATARLIGDENHNDGEMSATLTITKGVFDASGLTFGSESIEFDNQDHTVEVSGTLPDDSNITYSPTNTYKDAGEYPITATIKSTNYEDIVLETTLTITQAPTNLTFVNKSVTYNGDAHSILLSGTKPDGVEVTYTGNDQTEAGEHTVTLHINGGNNYKTEDKTAVLTIDEAELTGLTFGDVVIDYNGSEHSIVLTGDLKGGTPIYDNNKGTDAGTYIATVTLKSLNYKEYNNTATLTISKINIPNLIDDLQGGLRLEAEIGDLTYTGEPQTIVLVNVLPKGVTYEFNPATVTNVGEVSELTIIGGTNYNDVPAHEYNLGMKKADITGGSFNEATIELPVGGIDVSSLFTKPIDTTSFVEAIEFIPETITEAGVDISIEAKLTGTNNYNDVTITGKITVTEPDPI